MSYVIKIISKMVDFNSGQFSNLINKQINERHVVQNVNDGIQSEVYVRVV